MSFVTDFFPLKIFFRVGPVARSLIQFLLRKGSNQTIFQEFLIKFFSAAGLSTKSVLVVAVVGGGLL